MMDWTGIKVKTEPSIEPVTVAELKTFLRLDGTTYDVMLAGYITACRQAIERHTGRTMISTAYELYYDAFPADGDYLYLMRPPVQSVTSIHYADDDGTETLLAASTYRVDLASVYPRIGLALNQVWPSTANINNAVKITYAAGYGATAASVPAALRECVKSLAADLFEHPEANTEMRLEQNRTYEFLLNHFSIRRVV